LVNGNHESFKNRAISVKIRVKHAFFGEQGEEKEWKLLLDLL